MKISKKVTFWAYVIALSYLSSNLFSIAEENFNASITKNSINSYSDSLIMGEMPPQKQPFLTKNIDSFTENQKNNQDNEITVKNNSDYKIEDENVQLKNTAQSNIYNINLSSPKNLIVDNIDNVRKNILNGNYKKAEKSMDRIVSSDGQSAMDLAELAAFYEALNKKHKAIFAYERALEKQPNRIEILYNYSLCLYNAGNYSKAKYNLQKIIKINPDFMLAYYKLANIYHLKGDYLDAIRYYAISARINPMSSDTFYNLGSALESMNYNELASKYYTKCLNINPYDGQAAEALLRIENS
jgi:tetratricopeptide (TPR) repeat protein